MKAGDGDPRHGTANGYVNLGCRCKPCTAANTTEVKKRYPETAKKLLPKKRDRYKQLRAAGYSRDEAARRRDWSDPFREET